LQGVDDGDWYQGFMLNAVSTSDKMTFLPPTSTPLLNRKKTSQRRGSPRYTLLVTIAGIAVAEVIAMIIVYFFRTSLHYYQQIILDAAVMTVIIFPLLYFLSTRPLLRHIQQQTQTENILQARLRLIRYAHSHTLDELLQEVLDEVEGLTESRIGYFHFLEADQTTLWLRAWSSNTIKNMCTLASKDSHYDVDQAGVWADCIRERRPVIHNNYRSLPHRKGLPKGHAVVVREMAVPIMREGKVMAILGMGNKALDYTDVDLQTVMTLADFAWDIVRDKQAEQAARESEEKFRTLVDWTYDWEIWLDPQGNLVYGSPSCERITGYRQEEFVEHPDLMQRIIHPDDILFFEQHMQLLHLPTAGIATMQYRILAKDGSERWIEHICRPLFGTDERYLGRRISNRDITERKQAEQVIFERNQKEKQLTQTLHTIQLDIARDLHDTIGQNISFLRMKLDYLSGKKVLRLAEIKSELPTMMRAADESYDLIRGTLAILQLIDTADLHNLFMRYAQQVEERSAFKVYFATQGVVRSLSSTHMRQLFYVFREILNNIEKHASATEVKIETVWDQDSLKLQVADNGKGFDMDQIHFGGHYGLKFMRERVSLLSGTLTVSSVSGTGTTVLVKVPYDE
jgi:PAS domain S-box-containing protein